MTPAPLRLVHVAPRVQAGGGIETLLTLYATLPFEHTFVALFDRDPVPRPGYLNLDFTWRTTLGAMRRRFAAAMAEHQGAIVLWHNGWGFPLFAPHDGAVRRLMFLYADPAYHAPDLPGFRGHLDGIAGIVPALEAQWREELPELAAERAAMIGLPVEPIPLHPVRSYAGRPIVIGYAGRLEFHQKRLDRLAPFLAALERRGVAHRFEVLGEGSWGARLRRQLGHKVKFHGRVPREELRGVMANWDAAIYFSDHEGGPLGLLEAMATGAIPFYPAHGGSWGDVHTPQVDRLCYYPPGNIEAAAEAVAAMFRRPDAELQRLSTRARELVQIHTTDRHVARVTDFIRHIATLPAIARPPVPAQRWSDVLPLGFVTRFAPQLLRR